MLGVAESGLKAVQRIGIYIIIHRLIESWPSLVSTKSDAVGCFDIFGVPWIHLETVIFQPLVLLSPIGGKSIQFRPIDIMVHIPWAEMGGES